MTASGKILLACSLLACCACHAADISVPKSMSGRSVNGIVIEGEIKPGDYAKFVNVFLANRGQNYTVFLFSPGGDFSEALKIGRLIHTLKLTTVAPGVSTASLIEVHSPSNRVCASSCFFIFVAGAERWGDRVGIHRPYLPKEAYKKLSMDEAGQVNVVIRRMVEAYLAEVDVPSSYVERIMVVDSGDVEWLSEAEMQKNFSNFAPAYREWIEAKCLQPSISDKERMLQILKATPPQYKNLAVADVPLILPQFPGHPDKRFNIATRGEADEVQDEDTGEAGSQAL